MQIRNGYINITLKTKDLCGFIRYPKRFQEQTVSQELK
jgi:hypothetical protein